MKKSAIKYFLYSRKSLKDEDRQVISLASQQYELHSVAKHEGEAILEVFEESQSAKIPGRPIFNKMLDRIEAGEANGIMCWDIDRLYRNPIDEGRVRWLLQRGVLASIRTPSRHYLPQDAGLLMAVEGGRAVEHVLSMAKNLKRTHEAKLRRGQWPGPKSFGFIFDHRIRNIVPDPEKTPIILRFFEEFATGCLGFESGARWLAAQGLMGQNGKPYSKGEMRRILTNKKYIGVMEWKGETYSLDIPHMIPIELFNKVQQVMKVKSRPRKTRKGHDFPFRGIFNCSCGSMITAQWARGKLGGLYRYYRCTKKNGPCAEKYLQEKHLTDQCLDRLRPLTISVVEAREIQATIDIEEKNEASTLSQSIKKAEGSIAEIDEKLRKLTRCLLDEIIDESIYRTSKEQLVLEKTAFLQERDRLKKKGCNYWIEPSRTLISTLETLATMATAASQQQVVSQTAKLVRKIGTNPLISNKTATFSFGEDYDFLPCLLASARVSREEVAAKRHGDPDQRLKWCAV